MRRSVEAQKQKRAEWVLAQMCRSAEWDCPVLLRFCNQIMNCSTDRKIPQQTVQLFFITALIAVEMYKSRSIAPTRILAPPLAHAHDTRNRTSRSCNSPGRQKLTVDSRRRSGTEPTYGPFVLIGGGLDEFGNRPFQRTAEKLYCDEHAFREGG